MTAITSPHIPQMRCPVPIIPAILYALHTKHGQHGLRALDKASSIVTYGAMNSEG